MPDDEPFDHQTDQADNQRCNDEHGDKDIHAQLNCGDGGIAAHHHEFAMRQIDDFHHPEHHGQTSADQRK